jgi:DNA topoisomerase-3
LENETGIAAISVAAPKVLNCLKGERDMKLIIAEKPSLARNIVAGISGEMKKESGYFIGSEYIVSWAFGHLFSLVDIESYAEKPAESRGWTLDNLPCFPKEFKFELKRADGKREVDSGVMRQYKVLEKLCNRADVDAIINAGDADREGEIIVRLCVINALKSKKQLLRLWLPDQTPETVARALTEMKDEVEYDSLANEGFARTFIDWLYGVNLTRYATIRSGKLLRVGRVIVPIVRAIYERDLEIRNFKPEKYYVIHSEEKTNE